VQRHQTVQQNGRQTQQRKRQNASRQKINAAAAAGSGETGQAGGGGGGEPTAQAGTRCSSGRRMPRSEKVRIRLRYSEQVKGEMVSSRVQNEHPGR